MTMQLNLTPEEEKLVKEALAQENQTLEEAFMSFIYLKLSKIKSDDYPEFPVLDEGNTVHMVADEEGVFIVPEDASGHMKELLDCAE